jgi:hypothetical protein
MATAQPIGEPEAATSDANATPESDDSDPVEETTGDEALIPAVDATTGNDSPTDEMEEGEDEVAAVGDQPSSETVSPETTPSELSDRDTVEQAVDETAVEDPVPESGDDVVADASDDEQQLPTDDPEASGDDATTDPTDEEPADAESDCPGSGSIEYTFVDMQAWPVDALEKLTQALDEAIYYYTCYSDLNHSLRIAYQPGVPTAQANVDGLISFGSDRNYMVTATVMHEIGHTMGVGFYPWNELLEDGVWVGSNVEELMASIPVEERDMDEYAMRDYITCDTQHFWPYGLNYASEHMSEWSLINHVRIVAAMNRDKDALLAR